MSRSQLGLVSLFFLLLVVSLPLTIQLSRDTYRRLRGHRSLLTRSELIAKYRFLAELCGFFALYFVLVALPRLFFPRGSPWNLLGFPLSLAWLFLGPKPTKPAGHMPSARATPQDGPGIVLTRQEDPILVVALPVYIDQQRVGAIRSGESQTYALTPGVHALSLKPGRGSWGRTRPETFELTPGSWLYFECGESSERFGPAMLRHPERQIWLRATTTPTPSSAT